MNALASRWENKSLKHLIDYLPRAIILVVVIYLVSLAMPSMPSFVVALFWVAFTLISMIGILYQASVKKANKQQMFAPGGIMACINNGRSIRLIVSFVVSALLMASLLLESPKWDAAEWALIIVATVALYPLVELAIRRRASHEFEPIFRTAGAVRWTSIIVGVLLCTGYAIYALHDLGASQSQTTMTIFDALVATPQAFDGASSALLQEAGVGSWLIDSAINYGLTQISQLPWPLCVAIRVVLCAGAFFGMASLLSVCSLPFGELRKSFIPTDAIKNNSTKSPVKKPYVVWTVALSALLAGGFLWCDGQAAQAMKTESGTVLQSLTRQLAGKSVYIIDGKYYDQAKIDALAPSLASDQTNFRAMAFNLKDAIGETYEECGDNIDAFLDWYFSIATDGSTRSSIPTDGARQAIEEHFYALVTLDEDDGITEKVKEYLQAAADLEAKIGDGYREAEVHGESYANLPDWFVESKEFTGAAAVNTYRQQAENALDAARDTGILNALAEGKSLLEYQLESYAYGDEQFTKWVEAANGIAGESNILYDALHYVSGLFDQINRDSYREAVGTWLMECEKQSLALVSQNTVLE